MVPRLVNPSRDSGPRVRTGRGSARISCSLRGTSCSPWPSMRARITCCAGSNSNTRRGQWTVSLSLRRPASGRHDGPRGAVRHPVGAGALIETEFLEVRTMNDHEQGRKAELTSCTKAEFTPRTKAEFTPQLEEIRAMARQDVAVARERLAEGRDMVRGYVAREPVKALGIALGIGVILGWLIRRP